jgi:hypothetical protein
MDQFANATIDGDVQFVQTIVNKGRSLKAAANVTKSMPFVITAAVCHFAACYPCFPVATICWGPSCRTVALWSTLDKKLPR